SETQIAAKFAEAAESYRDNPVALHLRAMNMLYEGLREKGALIIVPSSAVDSMNLGGIAGFTGLAQAHRAMQGQDGGPAAVPPQPQKTSLSEGPSPAADPLAGAMGMADLPDLPKQ